MKEIFPKGNVPRVYIFCRDFHLLCHSTLVYNHNSLTVPRKALEMIIKAVAFLLFLNNES